MSTTTPVFIEPQTKLKFAITSITNSTTSYNDLHMRIQFPQHFGWGSVAIGTEMTGATMFIVYPSNDNTGATLSIRTATDEDEPIMLAGLTCQTQSMVTSNSTVDASFVCYRIGDDPRVLMKPASQWIWAVGPGGKSTGPNRDSSSVYLAEHNYYGSFSMNMVKAHVAAPPVARTNTAITGAHIAGLASATASALIPAITGTTSSGATTSATESMPHQSLINAHAVLLGGSFLIFFPLGIFLLRLYTVRAHWICQALATFLSFIGFMIAFAMSGMEGRPDSTFRTGHQILGIMLFVLMLPQLVLGWAHHMKFKKTGWGTWMAVPHINLGRIVMFLGLITGITGFKLSENDSGAVVYGLAAGAVIISIIVLTVWHRKKASKLTAAHGDDRPTEKLTTHATQPAYMPEGEPYEMERPDRVYQANSGGRGPLRLIYQDANGRWQPPA